MEKNPARRPGEVAGSLSLWEVSDLGLEAIGQDMPGKEAMTTFHPLGPLGDYAASEGYGRYRRLGR